MFVQMRSWLNMRRLTAAQRMAAEWECRAESLARRVDRQWKKLRVAKRLSDSQWESLEETMEGFDELKRRYATVIEALREENTVLSKVSVPTLVAQNKLVLERCNADMAAQVRRRVAATVGREEIE